MSSTCTAKTAAGCAAATQPNAAMVITLSSTVAAAGPAQIAERRVWTPSVTMTPPDNLRSHR